MEEFTPANSINEESFREGSRWRLLAWANGRKGKPILRIVNAVLHVGVCTVLLAIMIEFMLWYRGQKRRFVLFLPSPGELRSFVPDG